MFGPGAGNDRKLLGPSRGDPGPHRPNTVGADMLGGSTQELEHPKGVIWREWFAEGLCYHAGCSGVPVMLASAPGIVRWYTRQMLLFNGKARKFEIPHRFDSSRFHKEDSARG